MASSCPFLSKSFRKNRLLIPDYDIAKRGNSVIYASCENSELLSITDRIYVLFDGQVMAELVTSQTSEDEIMHYAVGNRARYA